MIKIDVGLKKIKTIFHISDVHIRTIKRLKNIEKYFQRFIKKLRREKMILLSIWVEILFTPN